MHIPAAEGPVVGARPHPEARPEVHFLLRPLGQMDDNLGCPCPRALGSGRRHPRCP